MADLGIVRFGLLGEGAGAAVALWPTLEPQAEIGSVVLAAPAGVPDEAFRQVTRPVLMLAGTEDKSDAGDRYRALLPDCNFMFVYGANCAIGAARPEALALSRSRSSSGAISSWSAERAGSHCLSLGLRRPARREYRWHD